MTTETGPSALLAAIQAEGESLEERLRNIRRYGRTSRRYTELGEISSGAMGRIVRVRDESLQRELAMKIVPIEPPRGKDAAAHARMLHRLLDEALITAHLDHPGIVPIHERILDDERGVVLFSMPLVRGLTLKRVFELVRTKQEGWTVHRALGVLHKVCETVAFAHEKGVIHRDLKPENIMVGPFGEAYVMDWGLALVLGREEDSVVGTVAYMAPEQAAGRQGEIGPEADVYSLGAILYELLGGAYPHQLSIEEGRRPEEVIGKRPRPMHELDPKVPPELIAICEKAMAQNRLRRYPNAKALARDLQAWLEGRVVATYETGTWARLRKWHKRNPKLSLALQALALAFLALPIQQYSKVRTVQAKNAVINYRAYVDNLSAASLGIRVLEIASVQRRLEHCDIGLRGWEWEHLSMRSDSSISSLPDTGDVQCLAIDSTGRFLATGADNGTVRLWNVENRWLQTTLASHARPVSSLRFSPDGERLASAYEDGVVRLWDRAAGALLAEWSGADRLTALAFSPREDFLVAGDHAGSLIFLGSRNARFLEKIDTEPVSALGFDPGTGYLFSGHVTGLLRQWDPGAQIFLHETIVGSTRVLALAFDPGGAWVAAAVAGRVSLFRTQDLEPLRAFGEEGASLTSLAVDSSGQRLLTGSTDSSIRLWNTTSGMRIATFLGHVATVMGVEFLPGSRQFVSGSEDATVRFWSADAAPEMVLEGHKGWVTSLAFCADGERLVSGGRDGTLRVWSTRTGEPLETLTAPSGVECVALGSGDEVVFGCGDPHPRVSLAGGAKPWLELDPGTAVEGDVFPVALVFHPSSRSIFARFRRGSIARWNLLDPSPSFVVSGFDDRVSAFAVPPSADTLAVGSSDGVISLLDAQTGKVQRVLRGPPGAISALAFDPQGNSIAAGSTEGQLWIGSLVDGVPAKHLDGHERLVTALAFDRDGKRLVSGSEDGTLRLWNPDGGEALLLLPGHTQGITAVVFRPGGDAIASASKDGTVRIWRTRRSLERPE